MLRTVPDRPGVTPFLRHYLLLSHPKVQVKQVFPLFKEDVGEVGLTILSTS